ncbi:MAG: carbohydrate ABC transporter permease [Candidatus Merdivicinus sp.]|jgi:putative aldouronate transport system permease protein
MQTNKAIRGYSGQKRKFGVFDTVVLAFIIIGILACLLPMLYIVAVSFSSKAAVSAMKVRFWPVEFTLETYQLIFSDAAMIRAMIFSILMTVLHTALAMVVTVCAAYVLNKDRLKGRHFFMTLMIITMYFSGGMIPDYINMKELQLLDTIWVLVLPGMLSVYNMIIVRSYFRSGIPPSVEESAYMDGCSDLGILIKIIIPLSMPVLSTITLFYAVGRWNGFMDALMYINDSKLFPIQLKLYQIIYNSMSLDIMQAEGASAMTQMPPDSLKTASVVFTTVPVLLIYPYLQKHFTAGVMLGSVKG